MVSIGTEMFATEEFFAADQTFIIKEIHVQDSGPNASIENVENMADVCDSCDAVLADSQR